MRAKNLEVATQSCFVEHLQWLENTREITSAGCIYCKVFDFKPANSQKHSVMNVFLKFFRKFS